MNPRVFLLKPTLLLALSLAAACGGELVSSGGGGEGTTSTSSSDGGGGTSSSDGGAGAGTSTSTSSSGGGGAGDTSPPFVISTIPANMAMGIATNANIYATFNEAMDPDTISGATFILKQGPLTIPGAVTYSGTVAKLNPTLNLLIDTEYTVTVNTGATDLAGNALLPAATWVFRTGTSDLNGPGLVDLGTAGNFVILSKTGITTIPTSAVTGDIGVSPIDSTALTGFSLMVDPSGTFAKSTQVTGNVYAADYISPTPSNLTVAINDLQTAYTDAAGRPTPDFTELGAGQIGGLTLVPGLYKWGTGVLISTDVTIDGGPNDTWIFQISGGITEASGIKVLLAGGAQAKNIVWQAADSVALGTGAHLEGIVLSEKEITLATGASVNGRLLSMTAVTLDKATVKQPQ